MKTIFECRDGGSDGLDSTIIGYCSIRELADRVVLGRGTMGSGDGDIQEIKVWEAEVDIPAPVLERIAQESQRAADRVTEKLAQAKSIIGELSPADRQKLLAELQQNL